MIGLANLQAAIADLLCDRSALEAFVAAPDDWMELRGLGAGHKRILQGMDPVSLQAFHEIRARDRAYFVEAVFPKSVARLGAAGLQAYFDAFSHGDDNLNVEIEQFVAFMSRTNANEPSADLARLEQAMFQLREEPWFRPAELTDRSAADMGALTPAPGIAFVASRWHLPSLLEHPDSDVFPEPGVAILRHDEEGVTPAWVDGTTGRVLQALISKDRDALKRCLATPEGEEAALRILAEGVLQ